VTAEERAELERRAERSLRRGELRDAVASFRALAAAFPADVALAERLALLEETLEPAELAATVGATRSDPSGTDHSPIHRAEALAGRGDFQGAIALYRKLLLEAPRAPLLSERLTELEQLADATRSNPVLSREHVLEGLLDRIATRRRAR
jgi:tetratricopeptide (TPR) repeat protein